MRHFSFAYAPSIASSIASFIAPTGFAIFLLRSIAPSSAPRDLQFLCYEALPPALPPELSLSDLQFFGYYKPYNEKGWIANSDVNIT